MPREFKAPWLGSEPESDREADGNRSSTQKDATGWPRPLDDRDGLGNAPARPDPGRPSTSGGGQGEAEMDGQAATRHQADLMEVEIEHLRQYAVATAREDAEAGVPADDRREAPESENVLRDRCRAVFQSWLTRERNRMLRRIGEIEDTLCEKLGRADLEIDRFERLTSELARLNARRSAKRRELEQELDERDRGKRRGISTRVYLLALGFLGIVEFFANAPVFSALLPRDPITEQKLRVMVETSSGWLSGLERVVAQLLLRPDAALLAAGVITFLCVLAHFFGHSLREFVMQRDPQARRETVSGRSPLENAIPMVLAGVGLILVVGVLYEARIILGNVGEERYQEDMAVVEELRREAGWLRVDGELLEANAKTNQAADLEAVATELREYATSMSRMSFPILLLNITLVLSALSAAYFHRRDAQGERFNEGPFDEERRSLIHAAEQLAADVSNLLAAVRRHLRQLRAAGDGMVESDSRAVAHQLEAVVRLYRAENGKARGLDPRTLPAFSRPVQLELESSLESFRVGVTREPEDYERERAALAERFEEARRYFKLQTLGDAGSDE